MGDGEYTTGRRRTGQHGHHIVDMRHREVVTVVRVLADRVLDLWLEAIALQRRDDVVAHICRPRAAGHVDLRADAFDVLERSSGTELVGRRDGGRGRRRQNRPHAEEREYGQGGQGEEDRDAAGPGGAIHGHILHCPRLVRDPGRGAVLHSRVRVLVGWGPVGSSLPRDRAADR